MTEQKTRPKNTVEKGKGWKWDVYPALLWMMSSFDRRHSIEDIEQTNSGTWSWCTNASPYLSSSVFTNMQVICILFLLHLQIPIHWMFFFSPYNNIQDKSSTYTQISSHLTVCTKVISPGLTGDFKRHKSGFIQKQITRNMFYNEKHGIVLIIFLLHLNNIYSFDITYMSDF